MKNCSKCEYCDGRFCINYKLMRSLPIDSVEFQDYLLTNDLNKNDDCGYFEERK
jgi:hypothetical protein